MNDKFQPWIDLNIEQVPKTREGFIFDGKAADLEALIKEKLDRTSMASELRKMQGQPTKASVWSTLCAKVDFLCSSERDLRLRFRRRTHSFTDAKKCRDVFVKSVTAVKTNIQEASADS